MKKCASNMSARELLADLHRFLLEAREPFLNWEEVARRIENGITYGQITLLHVAAIGMVSGGSLIKESEACEAVAAYCQAIQKESEKFDV